MLYYQILVIILIHYYYIYQAIERIIKLKIPIKTIHDSFYSNIKYKEIIHQVYLESYIELFESDPLQQILKNAFFNIYKNEQV